jgi:hypothetical protein
VLAVAGKTLTDWLLQQRCHEHRAAGVEQVTEADFDHVYSVNLKGVWLTMVAEIAHPSDGRTRRHRQQLQRR